MKEVAAAIAGLGHDAIDTLEQHNTFELSLPSGAFTLALEDVEVQTDDIPGMAVASERGTTLAVDLVLTPALLQEGLAREVVNRIQGLRKDSGLEITDRIQVWVSGATETLAAIAAYTEYIKAEVLADRLSTDVPPSHIFTLETELEGHLATFAMQRA